MCQGGYGVNILVSIEEAFINLAHVIVEEKEEVNNLTGAKMNLMTQVAEYANHLETKYSTMATIQETISHLQGKIKPLKSKLSGQTTNKTCTTQY